MNVRRGIGVDADLSCIRSLIRDQFKLSHIDQAKVGNAQFGDHHKGQQRMLHIGVVQRAAAIDASPASLFGFGGDLGCGLIRHQAGNGQFDQRQFEPSSLKR